MVHVVVYLPRKFDIRLTGGKTSILRQLSTFAFKLLVLFHFVGCKGGLYKCRYHRFKSSLNSLVWQCLRSGVASFVVDKRRFLWTARFKNRFWEKLFKSEIPHKYWPCGYDKSASVLTGTVRSLRSEQLICPVRCTSLLSVVLVSLYQQHVRPARRRRHGERVCCGRSSGFCLLSGNVEGKQGILRSCHIKKVSLGLLTARDPLLSLDICVKLASVVFCRASTYRMPRRTVGSSSW